MSILSSIAGWLSLTIFCQKSWQEQILCKEVLRKGVCKLSYYIFCICVLSSIDFVQQILVVKLCPYKNIECVLHILFVFYAVYLYFMPEVDFVQKIWGWFCMWNHVISKLHISGSLSRKSLPSRANRWPFAETWWSHICISICFLSILIKPQNYRPGWSSSFDWKHHRTLTLTFPRAEKCQKVETNLPARSMMEKNCTNLLWSMVNNHHLKFFLSLCKYFVIEA